MRILITGSREWVDVEQIRAALIKAGQEAGLHPQEVTVVHGGGRGADQIADRLAREFGCRVEAHPADWTQHGRAAGPRRNAEMVNRGAALCLAFPIGESRGTRGCIELCRRAGIPVIDYGTSADGKAS